MAFLDENGVQKLWSRIQEYVYECGCKGCDGGSVEPMMVQLVATKDQNDVIERLTIDADPQVLYDTFVSGKRILATIKPTTASETDQAVSEVVYAWRYASNGSVKYQFGLVGFEDATAGGNGYFKVNAYTNVVSGEQVYHIVDHGE